MCLAASTPPVLPVVRTRAGAHEPEQWVATLACTPWGCRWRARPQRWPSPSCGAGSSPESRKKGAPRHWARAVSLQWPGPRTSRAARSRQQVHNAWALCCTAAGAVAHCLAQASSVNPWQVGARSAARGSRGAPRPLHKEHTCKLLLICWDRQVSKWAEKDKWAVKDKWASEHTARLWGRTDVPCARS